MGQVGFDTQLPKFFILKKILKHITSCLFPLRVRNPTFFRSFETPTLNLQFFQETQTHNLQLYFLQSLC